MIEYKMVEWIRSIPQFQTEYQEYFYDRDDWADGWRIYNVGRKIHWSNLGTGNQACTFMELSDVLVPGYGDFGEDAWWIWYRWSNQNRTPAYIMIQFHLMREVPDPPPPEIPEGLTLVPEGV